MNLQRRVAIVTGGGREIGKCIAQQLAGEGASVALVGIEEAELEQTAAELRSAGRQSIAVLADVSLEDQVSAAVDRVRHELGEVEILVNNAGIIGPTAPVHQLRRPDWDEVLAVNVTGPMLCSQAVLPAMMERRRGKIINISSMAGKLAFPLRAPYCVSKWGLIGLTLTLAKEAASYDIQVNAICPGPVQGGRMRSVIADRARQLGRPEDEVEREYVQATLLGRFVNPDDVAAMAAFLASTAGDNITGQAIDVAAGYGL